MIRECQILIVGGGIAGVSTALYLSQAGREVLLLERKEVAAEASGVNAGMIDAEGWPHLPDLQATLKMGSLAIFKELQLDWGYEIEFRQSGNLSAIQTAAEYEFARDQVLRHRSLGYQEDLLTTREARCIEPGLNPQLLGAVFTSLAAQADPLKATMALAKAAHRGGAQIVTGCKVTAIDQENDALYLLQTTQGSFRCETLVLAAGCWMRTVGQMLEIDMPIWPVHGQMWATHPQPPCVMQTISALESELAWHLQPAVNRETPPNLTHHQGQRLVRHLYGRQRANGEIIFGGDRQLGDFDKRIDADGITVNRTQAFEVLPLLQDLPISRTWSGLMPFPLDGKPLIGALPQRKNLYIIGGLASSGFNRGPMGGRLLAEYIADGYRPSVLAEADPARFGGK